MMTPNETGRRIGGSLVLLSCVTFGSLQTQTASAADRATGGNTSGTDTCLKASGQGFQWKPALMQSGLMLASQHALRMVQPKTRRELGGPFFSDYFESVSTIHTWNVGFEAPGRIRSRVHSTAREESMLCPLSRIGYGC